MPVRSNILTNAASRDAFIQGVLLLNREISNVTTSGLGIQGPNTQLSTWDLFVLWHYYTMNTPTPAGASRNAAHMGPVFLPWHRWFLLLMEQQLQRVLSDANFGLPYWDWATDGGQPAAQQPNLPLWGFIGHGGFPIADGPFAFSAANPNSFRVRVWQSLISGQLEVVNRGLWRNLGQDAQGPNLPTLNDQGKVLDLDVYDDEGWDSGVVGSFRNQIEGWAGPRVPGMHNRVHVWVGGDMGPGTSPNDPVFYLNHCNVDRVWEAWNIAHNRPYAPPQTAPPSLFRHRREDPLLSMLTTQQPQVSQMLDLSQFVDAARVPTYDVLPALV